MVKEVLAGRAWAAGVREAFGWDNEHREASGSYADERWSFSARKLEPRRLFNATLHNGGRHFVSRHPLYPHVPRRTVGFHTATERLTCTTLSIETQ